AVHLRVAVVDRNRAQFTDRGMVTWRCRADHRDAVVTGQLYERRAHTAVGAQYDDRRAGADRGGTVQHLPGGDAVDQHSFRGGGRHAVRYRHQVGGIQQQGTGPAADFGDRGETAADEIGVHSRAGGRHRADHVVSGDEGEGGLIEVFPAAHLLLGERDARGGKSQDDLPGGGRGEFAGGDLEAVRFDFARQDYFGGVRGDGAVAHDEYPFA